MQPDPSHFAAGDYNLYRYCHNDPVNNSDPMGLEKLAGDIIFDMARYADTSNTSQGSFADFTNRAYMGPEGGGGGGATPIPRRADRNERVVLGGNGAKPMGDASHYTDEKLTANGEPAAGVTTTELVPREDGKVEAAVDVKVRRKDALKHPELLKKEWDHPDRWRIWVGRMNSKYGRDFARYPRNQTGAKAIRDFLEPLKENEEAEQNNDYHVNRPGKPAPHNWPYPLEP